MDELLVGVSLRAYLIGDGQKRKTMLVQEVVPWARGMFGELAQTRVWAEAKARGGALDQRSAEEPASTNFLKNSFDFASGRSQPSGASGREEQVFLFELEEEHLQKGLLSNKRGADVGKAHEPPIGSLDPNLSDSTESSVAVATASQTFDKNAQVAPVSVDTESGTGDAGQ